ncbi:MAG: ribonuclease T [Rhizobiales bacterium]|nr:ribonuclease T [Hyphomicrobiales bacterium]
MAVVAATIGTPAAARDEQPGRFDYLTLAISWSPTYCASDEKAEDEPQCTGVRPYAFVLHGLWPQYESGWPEFCRTPREPWVPKHVITEMLDIMPSPRLVIHQYRKHGTCSGLEAEPFFKASRALFKRVRIPEEFVRPENYIRTTPEAIEKAFIEANPGMKAEHIAIDCGRRAQLREVRICFTPRGAFRECTSNEDQRRLCRARQVTMPPVRARRGG